MGAKDICVSIPRSPDIPLCFFLSHLGTRRVREPTDSDIRLQMNSGRGENILSEKNHSAADFLSSEKSVQMSRTKKESVDFSKKK